MNKTLKYLLILLAFMPGFGFAEGDGGNDGGGGSDSTKASVGTNENSGETAELGLISPGMDVFEINPESYKVAHWDTTDFNIYGVDMNRFHDTLTYILDDSRYGRKFVTPVKGIITSKFGFRYGGFHSGIDIDLDTGDPVLAAMDGTVRMASYNRGYGNMVVICHEGGLETLYGHMSKLEVSEGQVVKAGQEIGLGGSTGRSTGPHLHLEFFIFGEQVNPLLILSPTTLTPISPVIRVDASWFDYLLDLKKIKYYEVKEGETLDDVAMMFEKGAEDLATLNGITLDTVLEPGRKILLE